MNIRCSFCKMPYTLSRIAMLDALQEMDAKKLTHYDAHCPRCKRATPIPRQRMEMAMPRWRDQLKEFEAEMKQHPQQAAPAPGSEPVADARQGAPAAEERSKPASKAETSPKPAAKPAPKAESAKKPAARKTPAAASSKGKAPAKKSK